MSALFLLLRLLTSSQVTRVRCRSSPLVALGLSGLVVYTLN